MIVPTTITTSATTTATAAAAAAKNRGECSSSLQKRMKKCNNKSLQNDEKLDHSACLQCKYPSLPPPPLLLTITTITT